MSWWVRNDGEVVDFDGDGPESADQQPDESDDNPEPPMSSGPHKSPRRGNPGRPE